MLDAIYLNSLARSCLWLIYASHFKYRATKRYATCMFHKILMSIILRALRACVSPWTLSFHIGAKPRREKRVKISHGSPPPHRQRKTITWLLCRHFGSAIASFFKFIATKRPRNKASGLYFREDIGSNGICQNHGHIFPQGHPLAFGMFLIPSCNTVNTVTRVLHELKTKLEGRSADRLTEPRHDFVHRKDNELICNDFTMKNLPN